MFAFSNNPLSFLFLFIAFLFAITVHEFAHAWMADRLGDPTAKLMGRLSLNPMAHLDLIGTLMILFAPFGWAKPVPVDPYNLRSPRRDSAVISVSGPVANIILAIMAALILQILIHFTLSSSVFGILFQSFIRLLIVLNVNLAIFNLIPIHPLDGFAIVEGFLSEQHARQWHELKQYGFIFLIFLVLPLFGQSAPITRIITPVINFILSLLLPGTGVI